MTAHPSEAPEPFDDESDLAASDRAERRVLWKEVAALGAVGALIVVRQRWLR